MWTIVPGSARDNKGNPVPIVNNKATTPTPASGSLIFGAASSIPAGPTWNPVIVTPWQENNTPRGTVTVGDPIVVETGGGNRETEPAGGS